MIHLYFIQHISMRFESSVVIPFYIRAVLLNGTTIVAATCTNSGNSGVRALVNRKTQTIPFVYLKSRNIFGRTQQHSSIQTRFISGSKLLFERKNMEEAYDHDKNNNSTDHGTTSTAETATNDDKKPICVPCSTMDQSHLLPIDMIQSRLENELPLWKLMEPTKDDDATDKQQSKTTHSTKTINYISRTFIAKNFQCALDSINAMGRVAEQEQHHPDFHLTNYRTVTVDVYTHKTGGITENDIKLARLLDSAIKKEYYSPKWLKEHPEVMTIATTNTSSLATIGSS